MALKPGKFPTEEEMKELRKGFKELKKILKKLEEEKKKKLDLLRKKWLN